MITKSSLRAVLVTPILLGILSFHTAQAQADDVYRWVDKAGLVHYTSKPPTKDSKPADLPPLLREGARPVKIELASCDKHGGVNCQAGPDKDGSVICLDGFTEATARFRFTCNSPKLQVSEISELDKDGQFRVTVRNTKSVQADKPVVAFNLPSGEKVNLDGPSKIEPYGNGDFVFKPKNKAVLASKAKPEQLVLSCFNCD
jgi:hypothetical protein